MSLVDVLAKDCLDIGVFTNSLEPMLEFWQETIGLTFDHMLPVGGGVRQHRHDLEGSVFKLNHAREALPSNPVRATGPSADVAQNQQAAGYLRIIIARHGLTVPQPFSDPDGNRVLLVPPGWNGIEQWAVEVATGSIEEFAAFYELGLGLPKFESADYACAVRCGRSVILGCVDAALQDESVEDSQRASSEMRRIGITYTTIQVQKVDSVYVKVLANGGLAGREPSTLGETARIAFVRDQRGNWMELSQRASLTGSLSVG